MPRQAKKKKAKLPDPATAKYASGVTLMIEGWEKYEKFYSAKERGQIALYLENKGLEELPERFTDNEDRVRQFNYTPQQKRGGKIPKEVLDE